MSIFFQFYDYLRRSLKYSTRSQFGPILMALLAILVIGSVAYALIEGWSPLDAFYATVITVTTVGYGDLSPQSPEGRVFAIIFTLIAISTGGYAISTFAIYFFEAHGRKVARKFRRRLMRKIDSFDGHYILCGANLIGTRISEEFALNGIDFVVIDDDVDRLKTTMLYSHPEYFQQKIQALTSFNETDLSEFEDMTLQELSEKVDIPYILENPTDDMSLVTAGIERATGVIAAVSDDRDNLSIVIGARSLAQRSQNTDLRIMAHVNDPKNMRKMYLAGANFVRISSIMSGLEMALHILHPEIGNWWYSHMGETKSAIGRFQQVDINERKSWIGQTISQIHQTEGTMIISVKRDGKFLSAPAHDLALKTDDVAIVITSETSTSKA